MTGIKKRNVITSFVVIAVLLSMGTIFLWFRGVMTRELDRTTERYLTENVSAVAAVFYTKLDDQMVMLESQSRYFQNVDLTDYNRMKETIKGTKGIGTFKSIGVASPSGATMNYNGMSSGNIMLTSYFQEAMSGQNAMSETIIMDEENEDVLVMAVPIWRGEEVSGVVYGTFSRDGLNELVDTVRFAESGTNLLITDKGTILARTEGEAAIRTDATNIFEEIPDINLPQGDESAYSVYEFGGQEMIIVLTGVGVHGWYFATIVPSTIVSAQSRRIAQYVLYVILLVSLLFVLLLLYILLYVRGSNRIQSRLEHKAESDPLTGILNTLAFQETVQNRLGENDGRVLALYIIDLDNFKKVNDTLGHVYGDKVLREVTARLHTVFREEDAVGRIGGDEFAACLQLAEKDTENAQDIFAERGAQICDALQMDAEDGTHVVHVSASVGFACAPDDGDSYRVLYQKADRALYHIKRNGKGNWAKFREAATPLEETAQEAKERA